jgi:carbamoyl-phosphate synthase large subunit
MKPNNVLISSIGRRSGLLACFRDSISVRGSKAQVFAVDAATSAPAAYLAAGTARVPRCTDPSFVDAVLAQCQEHAIGLVVPTIDPGLPVYAAARDRFAELGVTVCISAPQAVEICCNKVATHDWLIANGFPTVRQRRIQEALEDPAAWPYPLIVKPVKGSASVGIRRVSNRIELEAAGRAASDTIVQEIARGDEFTVNVYVNREGQCVCALPHWRMEVRAGEVSKGITVKDAGIMRLAREVASALPGAYGPLNIQCFKDEKGQIRIIEMNARFGGGYPLAHRAGARFTDWLLGEREGERIAYFDGWMNDLAMLRYDEAIYVPGSLVRA